MKVLLRLLILKTDLDFQLRMELAQQSILILQHGILYGEEIAMERSQENTLMI